MNEIVTKEAWDVPPAAPPALLTPMALLSDALAKGASIDVLRELMALAKEWDANNARKAFSAAIAAAKAEIPTIIKNRVVDFTSSKGRTHYRHEDLAEIARTVDPILSKHGLFYRFRTRSEINEPIRVTCVLEHRDGYFEENSLVGPRDETGNKNAHQAVASAVTLLQRYTLKAALGLAASDDDDGRAAGNGREDDLISSEQFGKLRSLMQEVSADEEKFLAYFKIEGLGDLPAKDFKRAVDALNAKRPKQ